MEIPHDTGPDEPAASAASPSHFLPLVIGGIVVLLGLLVGAGVLLSFERQQAAAPTNLSPTVRPHATPIPTPTPRPYVPTAAGIEKDEIVALLLQAAIDPENAYAGDHVQRWEHVAHVVLRGRPTQDDQACLARGVAEVNSAFIDPLLEISDDPREEDMAIYLLPRGEFSSVDADLPVEQPAVWAHRRNHDYSLNWARLVLDAELPAENRCHYIYQYLQDATGIMYAIDGSYGTSHFTAEPIPAGSSFSAYDLELFRALYSDQLVSGLSRVEVERRLRQE